MSDAKHLKLKDRSVAGCSQRIEEGRGDETDRYLTKGISGDVLERLRAAAKEPKPERPATMPLARLEVRVTLTKVADDRVQVVVETSKPYEGKERHELEWRPRENPDIAFGSPSMHMPREIKRKMGEMLLDDPIGTAYHSIYEHRYQPWRFDWRKP